MYHTSSGKSTSSLSLAHQSFVPIHFFPIGLAANCGKDFPLLYGHVVQLRHEKSGLYLAIESSAVAAKDPECIKCSLQRGSGASYFQVLGVFKLQIEGSPVCDAGQAKLLNCALGDHYLHSTHNEVNLSAKTHVPWTLALNRPHLENEADFFSLGQPVYLFHTEAEAYVMGTTNEAKQLQNALRLSSNESEIFKSAYVFAEVSDGHVIRGGPVHWYGLEI